MSLAAVLVIALLIALNGLYVAAEFAAVSVRRIRVRQMADEGNALAARLIVVLEDPQLLDRFIACCQVGITLTSLVLGAFGQARLAEALTPLFEGWGTLQGIGAQSTATVVVLIALTALQMLVGEVMPKTLALQRPTPVALATVLPVQVTERALGWFIAILNGSGWAILRLLRVKPTGHRHIHSPEEIRYLIAESREGGLLEPEEQVRLDRAIGLSQRTARELMVPRTRMVAFESATPLEVAVGRAVDVPYTRFPVFSDSLDQVVGLVHAKDLAKARLSGAGPGTIEPLVRPILSVHETMTADDVLSLLKARRGVMAVVRDEFGGTSGLLTVEDVLTAVLGPLGDENRAGERVPKRLPDGSVSLPGDLPLYVASSWVGVTLEAESTDTVGGMIAERLGRLARPGDVVEIDGIRIEVRTVQRNAVRSVIARPIPPASEDGEEAE